MVKERRLEKEGDKKKETEEEHKERKCKMRKVKG